MELSQSMKHLPDTALSLPQEGACVPYVVPVRDTLKRNTATKTALQGISSSMLPRDKIPKATPIFSGLPDTTDSLSTLPDHTDNVEVYLEEEYQKLEEVGLDMKYLIDFNVEYHVFRTA